MCRHLDDGDRRAMGDRLQAARFAAGLTLREVGAAVGVSIPAVRQWEQGALPADELRMALAVFYNTEPADLFAEYETKLDRIRRRWPGGADRDSRLDHVEWRLDCLDRTMWEHTDEEGYPNGFAHAKVVYDGDGDGVSELPTDTLEDLEARIADLERRLAAMLAAGSTSP
jgi:transcriptional regulator with XRE-family HTH domain